MGLLEIFSVKKRNGRMKCGSVKWLKRTKLEENAKNGAETDEV
jgi:hypothetical protein